MTPYIILAALAIITIGNNVDAKPNESHIQEILRSIDDNPKVQRNRKELADIVDMLNKNYKKKRTNIEKKSEDLYIGNIDGIPIMDSKDLKVVLEQAQKNYDQNVIAERNKELDKQNGLRVHLIKNPEVLEDFMKKLKRKELSTSSEISSSEDKNPIRRNVKPNMDSQVSIKNKDNADVGNINNNRTDTIGLHKSAKHKKTPSNDHGVVKSKKTGIKKERKNEINHYNQADDYVRETTEKENSNVGNKDDPANEWDVITKKYDWALNQSKDVENDSSGKLTKDRNSYHYQKRDKNKRKYDETTENDSYKSKKTQNKWHGESEYWDKPQNFNTKEKNSGNDRKKSNNKWNNENEWDVKGDSYNIQEKNEKKPRNYDDDWNIKSKTTKWDSKMEQQAEDNDWDLKVKKQKNGNIDWNESGKSKKNHEWDAVGVDLDQKSVEKTQWDDLDDHKDKASETKYKGSSESSRKNKWEKSNDSKNNDKKKWKKESSLNKPLNDPVKGKRKNDWSNKGSNEKDNWDRVTKITRANKQEVTAKKPDWNQPTVNYDNNNYKPKKSNYKPQIAEYYRPRQKVDRGVDHAFGRTPIPFIGKKGIYVDN